MSFAKFNILTLEISKCLVSILLIGLFCPFVTFGQPSKPSLDFEDYDIWKKIENEKISNDGNVVVYHEVPGKGDQILKIQSTSGQLLLSHERGESSAISQDSRIVTFKIKPHRDNIRALKRMKTEKEDMPKDSLGIYNIDVNVLSKIPNVKSYEHPEDWEGYVVYYLEEAYFDTSALVKKESTKTTETKKVSDENGYHLVVRNLNNTAEDTLKYVKAYTLAKDASVLLFHTTGIDSTELEGVHYYDITTKERKVLATGNFQYELLALSDDGDQAAFLMNEEHSKSYYPDFQLKYWTTQLDSAKTVVSASDLANYWMINKDQNLKFSQDGTRLYFQTAPRPMVKDTMLLDDEIIQVEVWSYEDQRLQTQQNVEIERDELKGYLAVYNTSSKKMVQLGDEHIPVITFGLDKKQNHRFLFGENANPYLKNMSWEGFPSRKNIFLIDQEDGSHQEIVRGVRGNGDLSPGGKFLYWYNLNDTAYYVYNIATSEIYNISSFIPTSIVDELDDHPDFPSPYGIAGWTENDNSILIYDRFDIWEIDLVLPSIANNLTNGRDIRNRHRIRRMDPDRPHIKFEEDLLHLFNEESRDEALAKIHSSGAVEILLQSSASLRNLKKSKNSNRLIYTSQTNEVFPDILTSDLKLENSLKLSNANPQQADRNWSSVELINWTSLDGLSLEGLLYKPEHFDEKKKYPMIVYFYERNSDNIHRYWAAYPHRSIINPSFYASRGYIVFIPDIVYRDGYPGPSCYNAVIPGVTHLIDQGFIDKDRIGVQGHSWGGYQAAYLITRTNIFACAESGAPVANMTSAYGGIRWGSGISRMFQYERAQSRIGGTLWDYPMRYFENSPIFFVDKINTPVLIMHNDHDTAVPWYQGIEFFVALRRLNKPVWMLNYNDEPHWPTKRENIVDFNIRMQQFFDHYLMDAEMPDWMERGIPAIEKGYNKGY